MTISPRGISFLVAQEDGDKAYYERTEEHWDWPEGASGPTIGVGYDCGYVTKQECWADWEGILDTDTVNLILAGVGFTGETAHEFVRANHNRITVTWAQALEEFTTREVPKWEKRMVGALPNWDHLSPDCAGALLSLGYNRGTAGFHSNLPRFREMRAIWHHMEGGVWPLIPGEIAKMPRLWPRSQDLRHRRMLEAQMFAAGVSECKPLIRPSSTAQSSTASTSSPSGESP